MLMKKRTTALLIVLATVIGLVIMTALSVSAQTASPTPLPAPSPKIVEAQTAAPSPSPAPSPRVKATEGHLELDDIIRVEVDHFSEWATTNDPTKLVPFINGRAIRGNYPEEIHPDQNRLHFHLEITPENKEVWTDLLGAPAGARRLVTFSVGLESQSPFESAFGQSNQLPLTVISPVYGVVSLLVILFTLILFLWLARKTNIIREPGPQPAGESCGHTIWVARKWPSGSSWFMYRTW